MGSCFQTKGMSMYDHGLDVRSWYVDLRESVLSESPPKREWRLPSWISSPRIRESLSSMDDALMGLYQVFHDCGKPLCRTVDEQGRQHFPDHAAVSRRTWIECSDGSPEAMHVADLIGMDMDVHLLSASGVAEFAGRPQAIALLLTGLCEIHSNSQMFGGTGSPGFKIKYKNVERFGSRIVGSL